MEMYDSRQKNHMGVIKEERDRGNVVKHKFTLLIIC
jgi:hypothetical protein